MKKLIVILTAIMACFLAGAVSPISAGDIKKALTTVQAKLERYPALDQTEFAKKIESRLEKISMKVLDEID